MAIDKSKFTALIEENQGIIHKVCSVYCLDCEVKKDIYQEIILRLWKAYPDFRNDSKFSTWMYKVSLNTVLSYLRQVKKRKTETINEESLNVPVQPGMIEEEEVILLYKAIGKLNEIDKAIMMLFLEEKPYNEIADILGLTPGNVGVRINRAKVKLEKLLAPYFEPAKN